MISTEEILTSSGAHPDRRPAASASVEMEATILADRLNRIFTSFGSQRAITSGFRTPEANKAADGSPNSHHLFGRAADVEDDNGEFTLWCLCEQELLGHFGLWMEDPRWTRKQKPSGKIVRWVHLQTKAPPSGKRVFRPAGPQPKVYI